MLPLCFQLPLCNVKETFERLSRKDSYYRIFLTQVVTANDDIMHSGVLSVYKIYN